MIETGTIKTVNTNDAPRSGAHMVLDYANPPSRGSVILGKAGEWLSRPIGKPMLGLVAISTAMTYVTESTVQESYKRILIDGGIWPFIFGYWFARSASRLILQCVDEAWRRYKALAQPDWNSALVLVLIVFTQLSVTNCWPYTLATLVTHLLHR